MAVPRILLVVAAITLGGGCGSSGASPADAGAVADAPAAVAPDAQPAACEPGVCQVTHGPVAPVGLDDVTYAHRTATPCFSDACFCDAAACGFVSSLLACDAVEGGNWSGLGSTYLRVVGRAGGACVFEVGGEVEGGVSISRCTVPLPMTPWPGLSGGSGLLDGVEQDCVQVGSCSVQPGGPSPCSDLAVPPPLCPPAAQTCCDVCPG